MDFVPRYRLHINRFTSSRADPCVCPYKKRVL
jgi:hypothetical protein